MCWIFILRFNFCAIKLQISNCVWNVLSLALLPNATQASCDFRMKKRRNRNAIDLFNEIIFHIRMGNGYFVDKNLTRSLIAQSSMFQHFRMSFGHPSICLSHLYAIKEAYIHSESTIITLIWFEILCVTIFLSYFDRFSLSLPLAHTQRLLSILFNWFFVLLLDFVMLFRHVQFCVIKENRSIDVPEKSLVVWETKKKEVFRNAHRNKL